MLLGDQWSHFRISISAGSDFQRAHLWFELGQNFFSRPFADGDSNGDGHAAFTSGAKASAHQGVHGLVHVGVRHDDHVVLGPTQGLAALAVGRSSGIDVLRNWRRTDEADSGNARVMQNGVHGFLVAMHHLKHAIGNAGFL